MRTKAVLCAAALAAGAFSSMAQSNVYSLNIVGYVNVPISAGVGFYSNPLDLDGTNSASSILNLTPLGATGTPGLDAFYLYTFNGSGFNTYYYESDFPGTGWNKDANGNVANEINPPNLNPGQGFILSTTLGAFTNTFVGNVKPGPGTTNSITVPSGVGLISSQLPVSGYVTNSSFQMPIVPLTLTGQPGLDAFYIYVFTGSAYQTYYYESDFPAPGWNKDANGNAANAIAPPQINIGQSFYTSTTLGSFPWAQHL